MQEKEKVRLTRHAKFTRRNSWISMASQARIDRIGSDRIGWTEKRRRISPRTRTQHGGFLSGSTQKKLTCLRIPSSPVEGNELTMSQTMRAFSKFVFFFSFQNYLNESCQHPMNSKYRILFLPICISGTKCQSLFRGLRVTASRRGKRRRGIGRAELGSTCGAATPASGQPLNISQCGCG